MRFNVHQKIQGILGFPFFLRKQDMEKCFYLRSCAAWYSKNLQLNYWRVD